MNEVLIYTKKSTPRLEYAATIIFSCVLKSDWQITNSEQAAIEFSGVVIDYGGTPTLPKALFVPSSPLLFQEYIQQQPVNYLLEQGNHLLFSQPNSNGLTFDVFSAVFFMVTRYEEYLPFQPDIFGRFTEKQSTSGRYGFTKMPIVHSWCRQLKEALQVKFNNYQPQPLPATLQFTYDIDVAFAFKGRDFFTHALSLAHNVVNKDWEIITDKWKSGFGSKWDPFDTYSFIVNQPVAAIFFFLLAKKRTAFDRNVAPTQPVLQQLIQNLQKTTTIGLHPSYFAFEKKGQLVQEKQTLQNIINQEITISRNHYLRFSFPDTPRQLLAAGITEDHSLMYAETPGFRAGISVPFPFFDVASNTITPLILVPPCIMDSAFRDDLSLTAAESLENYSQLWDTIQHYGGAMHCIWHNDLLAERKNATHPLNFRKTLLDFLATIKDSTNLIHFV